MSARERAIATTGRAGSQVSRAEQNFAQQREREAQRAMNAFSQMQDAPSQYVQEVIPQAVQDVGLARTVQGATQARQDAIQGGDLIGATSVGNLLKFFGYDPRAAALAQTERLMKMPRATFQDGLLTAPITGGGYLQQGMLGNVTYTGMPVAGYEGAFANLVRPAPPELKDDVVAPVVDPMTNQQQCPDGYEFDENLNACRKITPTEFAPITVPDVPEGRYARIGLLDQPPTGLLEAGFGSPADFAGANMAFRRQSAPMSSYFTDPRSYEGYTLI